MSPGRLRLVAVRATGLLVAMAAAGFAAAGAAHATPRTLEDALAAARPATAPFTELTETRVRVGAERLEVVVADATDERVQGLRRRSDIGPYDGMLFVFDGPTRGAFTMSTVRVPLDIAFYDEEGVVVDRLAMKPCARSESRCPVYRADAEYVYALETLAGELPRGRLRG